MPRTTHNLAVDAADVERLARQFEHDLRTPLKAMRLHLDVLGSMIDDFGARDPALAPMAATRTVEAVRREIRRIDEVAHALVSLLTHAPATRTRADVRETVAGAVADVRPLLTFAGVQCALIDPDRPVMLEASHALLRHGITNLLIGAVDDARIDRLEIRIDDSPSGVRLRAGGSSSAASNPTAGLPVASASSPTRARLRRAIAIEDIQESGGLVSVTDAVGAHGFEIEFASSAGSAPRPSS